MPAEAPTGSGQAAEAVRTLRAMVDIPSPSGGEQPLARYVADRMAGLGYAARIDDAGNAIGEIGDDAGPIVMMVGHLDTVPGAIPVQESGGALFGRGTVDAKGPLAAMMHAGARAAAAAPGARFVVVGAVDEERASRGAHHLLATADRPDALLIGEPSGVDAVVVGYKGILRFDYHVRRPWAHTSSPAERAVEVAAELWCAVRASMTDESPAGSAFDRAIPALTALEGDLGRARAEISCRLPLGFDAESFLDWVRGWREDSDVTVLEQLPAVRTSRADPLVRAVAGAVRRTVGTATVKVKLGTSDMNVLAPSWGVPAVAYGPGDSALDHTDDEHVRLDDYLLAVGALTEALPAVAAQLRGPADLTTIGSLPSAAIAARTRLPEGRR
ncbi:MAG: M20/M25/M40 family metallo-hydrolase [Frankiaceae bacterium]